MNEIANIERNLVGEMQSPDEYLVFNDSKMAQIFRLAEIMATGKATVPAHLRASPGDCMAICLQAAQWEMNPFAVAQKTHIVNGTLGYEAQLVIAVIDARAPIKGRLKFDWEGDWSSVAGKSDKSNGLAVTCSATFIGDEEPTSHRVSMAQAGIRNSPLWEHDPKMQLAYLCAKRWARLHCPDVILGVYTPDELESIQLVPETAGPAPNPASRTEAIKAKINESLILSGAAPAIIEEPPAPPINMNPETGEVVGDPIAGLLLALSECATNEKLEEFRPAMAGLKAGEDKDLYRRALVAWTAAKARIKTSTEPS